MKSSPGVKININQVPKVLRKKANLIRKLWQQFNIIKLREVRDSSISVEIHIFHHSFGTDSYYHDLEGRYYTWEELENLNKKKMDNGKTIMTVVMPYKSGIVFHKSSLAPHPSLN